MDTANQVKKTPDYSCALVTGASSGIGEGFAEELAEAGTDLILVARSADKLEALAARLRQKTGRQITVIPLDLTRPDAASTLLADVQARGLKIDLLVSNAGFGSVGGFLDQPLERYREMVALNGMAMVELAYAFIPLMKAQGRGAIINVASIGSFQPMPGMAVYGASKAFALSFSEALWEECRRIGIRVMALCPGPTDTGFFQASGRAELRDDVPKSLMMTSRECARRALQALARGRSVLVAGWETRVFSELHRFLPRQWMTRLSASMHMR